MVFFSFFTCRPFRVFGFASLVGFFSTSCSLFLHMQILFGFGFSLFFGFFDFMLFSPAYFRIYITGKVSPRSWSIPSAPASLRAGADEVTMLANTPSNHFKSGVSFGAAFLGTTFRGWKKWQGGGAGKGDVGRGRTFRGRPRFWGRIQNRPALPSQARQFQH